MGMNHAEKTNFACMMGTVEMKTEGKEKEAVDATNNEEFAWIVDIIGGGSQNTKESQVINYYG